MSLQIFRRLGPKRMTENQLNALVIALENRMTPLESYEISKEFSAGSVEKVPVVPALVEPALRFAQHQALHLATAGKQMPERFWRQRVRKQMRLFSDPSVPRHEKTLVLCFTGRAHRMTMPLAPFLQHLDASTMDVAVISPVRAHDRLDFMFGFSGLGESIYDSIDYLPSVLKIQDYVQTIAIGASGGGIPAIVAALRLGLPTAVAAAPSNPNDPRWPEAFGAELPDELNRLACLGAMPAIHVVYAPQNLRDKASAEALAGILPVNLFKVFAPEASSQNLHAILGFAMIHGRLAELLAATLFSIAPRKQENLLRSPK